MTAPELQADKVITFFYYRDLPGAVGFYDRILGLPVAIDQGWCKIYHLGGSAHLGLVDEARGLRKAARDKPVQFCIRVPDVDAWHAHVSGSGVAGVSDIFEIEGLGFRAFVFEDPEGYQIEIQSLTGDRT